MIKKYLSSLILNFILVSLTFSYDYFNSAETVLIHYDNDNSGYKYFFNGYNSYEVGVHFISDKLKKFKDKKISKVRVYFYEAPDNLTLRFYNSESGNNENNLIYSQIIDGCKSYSWNEIYLDVPLTIIYEDIWLGINIKTDDFSKPIVGLDNGPGFLHANLYKTDDGWEHLGIDKNWNIQVVVSD